VPFISFFSRVKNVNTDFRSHVEAVVWASTNAGFAGGTGLPNDTDSTVIISRDEEPRLHVFKALVRVHHGHWALKEWKQISRLAVSRIRVSLGEVVVTDSREGEIILQIDLFTMIIVL
jgi:hypothetical protein